MIRKKKRHRKFPCWKKFFPHPHKVFETVIPRNVRLSEAPSHGLPALIYDHRCPGSAAYIALARELIDRLPDARKAA